MTYTPTKFAIATAALFWLTATPNAQAEPSEGDQKVRKLMNFVEDSGAVFMEVNIAEHDKPGLKHCNRINVRTKADTTGVIDTVVVQDSPMLFGKLSKYSFYGGIAVIPAGAYTIQSIGCEGAVPLGLGGPFAKFTVQAGQMLNLGNLQVLYKLGPIQLFGRPDNKGEWRVADISPRAAASIAKRWPESFGNAKKQYMTAIREAAR